MKKGFTIVELMISLLVAMVVLGGVYTTFKNQNLIYQRQEMRLRMGQDIRIAIDLMQRYLRRTGIRTSGATYNIEPGISSSSSPSKIIFSSDVNRDGQINGATSIMDAENQAFIYNGSSLYFCYDTTGYVEAQCEFILDNIKTNGFNIKYYDSGSNIVSPDVANKVEITLTIEAPQSESIENSVMESETITTTIYFINKSF